MNTLTRDRHLALHRWLGLGAGLVLFVLFLSGALTVFHHELEQWQQPVASQSHPAAGRPDLDAFMQQRLARESAPVEEFALVLPRPGHPALDLDLHVEDPEAEEGHRDVHEHYAVTAAGGLASIDDPQPGLAAFIADLHTHLHLPHVLAAWILGPAAMAMLAMLITGIYGYYRLLRNLFTFRPAGARSLAWSDFHKVIGLWSLPFLVLIALTSIPMGLHYGPWLSWVSVGAAQGDTGEFNYAAFFDRSWGEATGETAPLASLEAILADATSRAPGFDPARIAVHHPGDAGARVLVTGYSEKAASIGPVLVYDGSSGAFLETAPSGEAEGGFAGNKLFNLMFSLHFGDFAGVTSRALWFLFGLAAAIIAATGTKLWLIKRAGRDAQAEPGVRLMEALNVAVCGGLPLALAASFAAWPVQRWLAPEFTGYGGSAMVLCGTWALAFAAGFATRRTERLGTAMIIAAAALAVLAVALRGALLGDSPWQALAAGRMPTFLIDLLLFATGGATLAIAWLRQRSRATLTTEPAREAVIEQQPEAGSA